MQRNTVLFMTPVNVLFVSCQQEREQVSEKDGREVKKREKHIERLMEADYTASLAEASSDKGFVCWVSCKSPAL